MFVDSRLHISVRPALEYKLPHAAQVIKGVILGDHASDLGCRALQDCLDDLHKDPPSEALDHDSITPTEVELRRMCTSVCTHMDEHLQRLSAEWQNHLALLWSNVQRGTDKLNKEVEYAKSVKNRYVHRNSAMVQREYRNELLRIESQLDELLQELRNRCEPSMERPSELCEECTLLKEVFPRAYGSIPTPDLVRIKRDFENNVFYLQKAVAEDFVSHAKAYLVH